MYPSGQYGREGKIEQTFTQKKQQQPLQTQSNLQRLLQQDVIETVDRYILSARLQEKQKIIQNLNQQLKDEEEKIKKIQEKHRQELQSKQQQKAEEIRNKITQLSGRENKIEEQVRYIQQAEKKRDKSLDLIRKLFTESNDAIQTKKEQILEQIGLSRQNNDQNLKNQKKMISQSTELTSMKQNLQIAANKHKQLENKLKQNETQLGRFKAKESQRQLEFRTKNTQLDQQYQSLKQSVQRQVKTLEQRHKKQVDNLQQQLQVFKGNKSNYQKQLNQIITSQKELKDTLSTIRRQKQALQNRQNQQKLKMDQLNQVNTQLSNKLQQKTLYQQQIKRLKLDLTRKEQMIAQSKTIYDQKSSDLEISYRNFKIQQKQKYESQKSKNEGLQFNKIFQLNKNITDLTKEKDNFKNACIQAQEKIKNQQQSVKSKIAILEQEIRNYKNVIYQFKNCLNAQAKIPNNIEDAEQILNHLKLVIKNLKDAAAANKYQEQKAKLSTASLKQLCEFHKLMLAKLNQNVKSINNYKKMKEQPDNNNHLGFLINRLADNIKSLVEQKENIVNLKLQIIQTTENQNKSLSKELNILKSNFAQLNRKQNQLQIQNRTLKLNAESNNIQKEKMKDNKQELNHLMELQIREVRQQLQKSKYQSQQQKRINKELRIQIQMLKNKNQSEQLIRKISQLNKNIQSLNQGLNIQKEINRTQTKKLQQQKERNKTLQLSITLLNKELGKLKQEMKQKELNLKQQFDNSLLQISKTLQEVSGSELQNKETNGIVQFIRKNGCSSSNSNTSFTVSEILQKLPKQRSFLVDECCKFFGVKFISTKLSYKYDQSCKNFSYYLPTATNKFLFAVILKTKKNVIFGLVSNFVGRESKAFAFNLNTRKIMNKSPRAKISSTNYQSSMLKFGNDEIVLRNNSNLEIRVNTMILGERYFEFIKDDLVGKGETGDYVQLEGFQIHKIIAV